jgi:hypothetical protein
MDGWDPAATALVKLLPQTGRGPKRGGIFALWLTMRVAQDVLLDPPLLERSQRRRLQALEHRLSSITMAPPLRRALTGAVNQLKDLRPESAVQVLSLLVAPAREVGGTEAGEAVALAARIARQRLHQTSESPPSRSSGQGIGSSKASRGSGVRARG